MRSALLLPVASHVATTIASSYGSHNKRIVRSQLMDSSGMIRQHNQIRSLSPPPIRNACRGDASACAPFGNICHRNDDRHQLSSVGHQQSLPTFCASYHRTTNNDILRQLSQDHLQQTIVHDAKPSVMSNIRITQHTIPQQRYHP